MTENDKTDHTPSERGDPHGAAFKDRRQPGPDGALAQVRPAGAESTRDDTAWDSRDEASDESFPASDASARY